MLFINKGLLTTIASWQSLKAIIVSRPLLVHCALKKTAEAVLLYVFKIAFPAFLFKRIQNLQCFLVANTIGTYSYYLYVVNLQMALLDNINSPLKSTEWQQGLHKLLTDPV